MSEENKPELGQGSDQEPQLFALTRDAGGCRLDRRGFLKAVGAAAAGAGTMSIEAQQGAAGEKRLRPPGNRMLVDGQAGTLPLAHCGTVYSVVFSSGGKLLASGSDDYTIKLWSLPEGKLAATLQGHKSRVNSVSFSPDGKLLASGSDDKTIRLWELEGSWSARERPRRDGWRTRGFCSWPPGTIASMRRLPRRWA